VNASDSSANARVSHRSRRFVFLFVYAVVVTLIACWYFGNHVVQSIRIAFAADQIAIFDLSLRNALKAEPLFAAEHLRYVVDYYQSGTKQSAGSTLDRMVEAHRASVVREIIAHLRKKTGIDLGDDPEAWIKRFSARGVAL
jgi:hypothetical protein